MSSRPDILRLGHVILGVRDLDASRAFYVDVLGMNVVHEERGALYLRGYEDREWSLKLETAKLPSLKQIALKARDEGSLDQAVGVARDANLPVREGKERDRPRLIHIEDPQGFPIAFYAAAGKHERLLQSYHRYRGPGLLRIDHVNLFSTDVQELHDFYTGVLGFSLTEYTVDSDGNLWGAWLQRKGNVHDIALSTGAGPRLHHFAYWLATPADVLRAADIVSAAGHSAMIERAPGRHGLSNAMFVYLRDPDGHRIELYTSDYLTIDPDVEPLEWKLDDPQRQTLWGQVSPKSFLEDATPVENFHGDVAATSQPRNLALPPHAN